jgi:Cupin
MLSRGNCWLSVEGIAEPIPLTGGDCFLLAKGTSIVLRDSLRTRPRWSFREIGAKANGNVALCGGGGAPTTIVCGSLSFDRASLRPITHRGRSNPWPKPRACLAPHSQHVSKSYSDKRRWNT